MQEKDLISAIKGLKGIKPRENWAFSLKKEILGFPEQRTSVLSILAQSIFQRRASYAAITIFGILIGLFGISTTSLPGDPLFGMKKMAETSEAALLGINHSKSSLEIANNRFEDLTAIVKMNKTSSLVSAMQEVQDSVGRAVKNLSQSIKDNPESLGELAVQVREIERSKKNLETLGVFMTSTNEIVGFNNVLIMLLQGEIASLEGTSLNEDQQNSLQEIKDLYLAGNYPEALERILMMDIAN